MNRNAEQHYSQVPHANVPRARFKRDYSLLTTMNEGDLVPIYCDEVLPADTAKIDLNALMRMSTPLYPVMDNCYCDFYFFFVPSRLLWEHFENLMGQNDSTFWAEPVEYTTPKVTSKTGWEVGTIADYMGIPTGVKNLSVNALPFRAYAKIWNEWFRDENLQQPTKVDKSDTTHTYDNAKEEDNNEINRAQIGGKPLKVCKYKDYFTSCLPSPQKGEAVKLPLTGNANVIALINGEPDDSRVYFRDGYPSTIGETKYSYGNNEISASGKGSVYTLNGATKETGTAGGAFNELYADMSSVTAATINELRQAIAVQHILERDARTGTRYKEYLQGAWGVTSPDARLDRSEYIGGYRLPININQVIQTSSTDSTSPQGNTAAFSMTTMSRNMATYSATEHGFILGLAAVRVDHSYQQGLARMWTRSTRFSYYDPMLANLGEQAVLNQEIYAQGTAVDEEVFGYQEAWADYRYHTNMITGEMRSTYAQTLDAWHYADKYTELPILSSKWIKEGKENIDRTIAVQSNNSRQFICNFYFDQTWTRAMPIYSLPGLDTI